MNPMIALAFACLAFLPTLPSLASAAPPEPGFKVLKSLPGGRQGKLSYGRLVGNPKTVLYGTTSQGGSDNETCQGCGTIFKLEPGTDDAWTLTTIYRFKGNPDGYGPMGGMLLVDGELYGTTRNGGANGRGTIFKLKPARSGATWKKTILHSFGATGDGTFPAGELVRDSVSGAFYGTTPSGGGTGCGGYGCGTVYRLSRAAGDAPWVETVIHRFTGAGDGRQPESGVRLSEGSLYGATLQGGGSANCPNGCGVVYRLDPPGTGDLWTSTTLHAFAGGADGQYPMARPVVDGAIYGSTREGGDVTKCGTGCGTVFMLTEPNYDLVKLHDFTGDDGYQPTAALSKDDEGNLYGTTQLGGFDRCSSSPGCGVLFKLEPPTLPGPWTRTVLRSFRPGKDGNWPYAELLFHGRSNALFGVTPYGGGANAGTVFRYQLPPAD